MIVTNTFLNQLIAWGQNQEEILALYLYGSQIQGKTNTLSDIDIGLLVQSDLPRSQIWRLEDQWASQWPEYIDIRILNLAPLPFRYEITAQGQRLWATEVNMVAEIESLIWRQYWDIQPRLEQGWKQYVEYVMENKNEAERQQYQTTLAKVRAVHQRVRETSAKYTKGLQE